MSVVDLTLQLLADVAAIFSFLIPFVGSWRLRPMAKQPWYMPFFWPLGHVTNALKLSVSEALEPLEAGHLHYLHLQSWNLFCTKTSGKIQIEITWECWGTFLEMMPWCLVFKATPDLDFIGHVTSVVASLRSFLLAYLAITATESRIESSLLLPWDKRNSQCRMSSRSMNDPTTGNRFCWWRVC